jgi:hypothetical protein
MVSWISKRGLADPTSPEAQEKLRRMSHDVALGSAGLALILMAIGVWPVDNLFKIGAIAFVSAWVYFGFRWINRGL